MKEQFIEDVYDTLRGIRSPQSRVEGVENLFAPGGECARLYGRMLDAYDRLRTRLGVEDEDKDVEIIISSLMGMERQISCRMCMNMAQGLERTDHEKTAAPFRSGGIFFD